VFELVKLKLYTPMDMTSCYLRYSNWPILWLCICWLFAVEQSSIYKSLYTLK